MGRGDSFDKYLTRLDAEDAERARTREEQAAAHGAAVAERSRLVRRVAEELSARGLPPEDVPSRRLVKLPFTRRPRGTKATRVGDLPRRIDREVVEEPSGIRGWTTGAHVVGHKGDQSVHHPLYVSTDGRLVAPTRLERLTEGPATHGGQQVQWYSPGWRYIEPPERVEVRADEDPEGSWTSVPLTEHLAGFLDVVQGMEGSADADG